MLPQDGDGERELSSLLASASLVRGAVQAISVPETAVAASRDRCIAMVQHEWEERRERGERRRPWSSFLGGWLRVVFTFWRRR
jgi:hypothetical protein